MGCFLHRRVPLAIALGLALGVAPGQRAIAGRVVDSEGKPVAAEVFLRWRVHPELPWLVGYSLGDGGIAERKLRADERGRFRIAPPHRGPFLLVAKSDGESSTQEFPVLSGDYHNLRLEKSHYMAGVVRTPDGKPAVGATVRLLPTDDLQLIRVGLYRQPERRATVKTDEAGRFRLLFEHGYLREPRWNTLMAVSAEHLGRVIQSDHQRPTSSSKSMQLVLGEIASVKIQAIDQTGAPIAGVRVVDPILPQRTVTTDAKGRCEITPLRSKVFLYGKRHQPYTLSVRPSKHRAVYRPPLAPGLKLRTKLTGPKGPLDGARLLFAIPSGDGAHHEWEDTVGEGGVVDVRSMPANRRVLGFVEHEGEFFQFYEGLQTRDIELPPRKIRDDLHVSGRVFDSRRMPVAGARVELRSLANAPGFARRATYTDRAGRFRFDHPYHVDSQVIIAKGELGQTAVTVRRKDFETPLRITLEPQTKISGKVLGPDGEPVAGAWVNLYGVSSGGNGLISGPRTTSTCLGTMTNERGEFRLGTRRGTSWTIVAAHLDEGAHCNVSSTARAGQSGIVLKSTVQNR